MLYDDIALFEKKQLSNKAFLDHAFIHMRSLMRAPTIRSSTR